MTEERCQVFSCRHAVKLAVKLQDPADAPAVIFKPDKLCPSCKECKSSNFYYGKESPKSQSPLQNSETPSERNLADRITAAANLRLSDATSAYAKLLAAIKLSPRALQHWNEMRVQWVRELMEDAEVGETVLDISLRKWGEELDGMLWSAVESGMDIESEWDLCVLWTCLENEELV